MPEVPADTGNSNIEGGSYGEVPYLDGLWNQCAEGDMFTCDHLFKRSEPGSEYFVGDTCGYRVTDNLSWCEDIDF